MAGNVAHPVRISLFGIGCKVWVGKFSAEEWEHLNQVAKKINMVLTSAVFTSAFYTQLDNPAIRCLADMGNFRHFSGLLNSNHSLIQIQVYRKRRRNITFSEITRPTTLFPIYNTSLQNEDIEIDKRTLFIVEKEIGLFQKYYVDVRLFTLEKLQFEFLQVKAEPDQSFKMLTNLYLKEKQLIPKEGNGLVCTQYALTGRMLKT